jgi:hypothetical protein
MIGICPAEIGGMHIGLSPVLRQKMDEIIALVLEELTDIRQKYSLSL